MWKCFNCGKIFEEPKQVDSGFTSDYNGSVEYTEFLEDICHNCEDNDIEETKIIYKEDLIDCFNALIEKINNDKDEGYTESEIDSWTDNLYEEIERRYV